MLPPYAGLVALLLSVSQAARIDGTWELARIFRSGATGRTRPVAARAGGGGAGRWGLPPPTQPRRPPAFLPRPAAPAGPPPSARAGLEGGPADAIYVVPPGSDPLAERSPDRTPRETP